MNFTNIVRAFKAALRGDWSIRPIGEYPSSIIDSLGCEFGYEMYYHVGYAYHLHQQGLLKRTRSCRDTKCFYWFSPDHIECYQQRRYVFFSNTCIAQLTNKAPDISRWLIPDFRRQYVNRIDCQFSLPTLLVFNKYNREWGGEPVNYLSKEFLLKLATWAQGRYQIVYFRPTKKIVADHSDMYDLGEKTELSNLGVLIAEDLHDEYSHLTFNEFQLCLLAQSSLRIAVQGGATYLNALFPGKLMVLHRKGFEIEEGTYEVFRKMHVEDVSVYEEENRLLESICKSDI